MGGPSLCGLVLAAGCAAQAGGIPTPLTTAPSTQPTPDCAPVDGVEFLCGVTNVEQLVGVDGTRWPAGSSAAGGSTELAPLYFLYLDTHQVTPLGPHRADPVPVLTSYLSVFEKWIAPLTLPGGRSMVHSVIRP